MAQGDSISLEVKQLQAYSNAQANTIVELSKKLKIKEDEITHLKKLLEGSVPLVKENSNGVLKFEASDQEYICRTEINKLRDISRDRELSLEDCKKFDIYSKILKDLQNAPKTIEIQAKKLSDAELLAVIEAEEKANE